VIGRAGHEGGGAIDLFGQHGADKGMGPGLRAEGNLPVRPGQNRRIQAIGASHHEDETRDSTVFQPRQKVGEAARGEGGRVFVARDDKAILKPSAQGLGLGRLARLSALNLDDLHGPQAMDAPGARRPGGPIRGQAGFWAIPQPPNAEKRDLQAQWALTPRWPESTDQIFSIL